MKVEVTIKPDQWERVLYYMDRQLIHGVAKYYSSAFAVTALFIAGVYLIEDQLKINNAETFNYLYLLCVIVPMVFFAKATTYSKNKVSSNMVNQTTETTLGPTQHEFDDIGIHSKGSGWNSFYSWALIKGVDQTDGLAIFFIDLDHLIVIPEEQIGDLDRFKKYVNERMKASGISY